jgi:hypothetical protein
MAGFISTPLGKATFTCAGCGTHDGLAWINGVELCVKCTSTLRTRIGCESCEVLYINGIKCHEPGCPDAWQDEYRECAWCGSEFKPEERDQRFCDDECQESYYN